MRARKNFSYLALLSLQSAPIPRKGKRPSLNLGDDTNFFAQFECAPLSSIIRRSVAHRPLFTSQLGKQGTKHREHLPRGPEPLGAADAARDELEVAPANFQAEGPRDQFQVGESALHLFGEIRQDHFHLAAIGEVSLEGDLLADRFPLTDRLAGP